MSDIYTQRKRSSIMSKVRSTGNKSTEIRLIELFRKNKIKGWRRRYKVKGHPDFVFLNKKIAIFVDGCFWHGHNCRKNLYPEDNSDYWQKKRAHNIKRDKEITSLFESRGWTVIRIWECELKRKNTKQAIAKLEKSGISGQDD